MDEARRSATRRGGGTRAADTPSADDLVGEVAASLSERFPDLTRGMRTALGDAISVLVQDDRLLDLLGDAIEGNVATILHMLRHGIPLEEVEIPTAAVAHARRLAQHGVTTNALVRAYRLGQAHLLEACHAELARRDASPGVGLDALNLLTVRTFAYIDWISQQVVTAYEAEREQWVRQQDAARTAQIKDMIAGRERGGSAAAEKLLRHRLQQHHLAAIVWARHTTSTNEAESLDESVSVLTRLLGGDAPPLVCSADRATRWLWFGRGSDAGDPDARRVESSLRRAGLEFARVAVGGVEFGAHGFRRSHLQAAQTCPVLQHAGSTGPRVVGYREPGVAAAAMLARDPEGARLLVRSALGPLALDDAPSERLRETLLAFLECGSSYTAASARHALHKNSVKYRVERAVEQRGRPVGDDRIDLELALVACRWLGDVVLGDAGAAE